MVNASEYLQWYYLIYLVPGGNALPPQASVTLLLACVSVGARAEGAGFV